MNSEELLDEDVIQDQNKREGQIEYEYGNKDSLLLNDRSIYYKGLFGMILCIAPGAIIGLVLVKMSLDQSKAAIKSYNVNPGMYKDSSYKKVKKGRVFGYIGLSMFILEILAFLFYAG